MPKVELVISYMLQAQSYYLKNQFGVDFDNSTQTEQWYLDVIQAQDAWEITRGDQEVPIAYICANGVYWLHEDLGEYDAGFDNLRRTGAGNAEHWGYWNIPDIENTDDDGNGYVDDWRGIYFKQNSVTNNTLNDGDILHSTWIAGIMSAKNNDAIGIYGIAGGGVDMGNSLIISSYNYDGPDFSFVSSAINYAVQNGARVILIDGLVSYTQYAWGSIPSAIDNAFNSGCFVIAPTGWSGDNQLFFPSSYYDESTGYSVFSVGASTKPDVNSNEYKHALSNYGYGFNNPASNTPIDLVAPGEQIYTTSTVAQDEYLNIKGVAPAAAMVASTVGLMLSVNPELTYNEIETILHETAEKIGQDDYYTYDANGWNEYVGYGRLNTYAAVCAALETAAPVEVVDNATWDQPVFSLNDIVVPEDYNLTITSTVYFGNEASLIIEPGATVTIDGGTLTNYKFCGNEDLLWQGVEVWGDPSQHQYSTSGSCAQGKIVLRNGAIIENAEIGVLLAARDDNSEGDFVNGGGIIEISNNANPDIQTAIFRNNKKSVYFYSYHNFLPNDPDKKEAANLSKFENCKFSVNADYLEGDWYYSHVYLLDVDGVHFRGCTFENATATETTGHGINAYHAGFTVEAICNSSQSPCPEEYLDKNTFSNFYKGINLMNGGVYTLTAEHADFSGNTTGIMLSNVNNATVLSCNFNIGANTADAGQCEGEGKQASGYGIDLDQCTGFAIEENNFSPATTGGLYTGIRVLDCPSVWDIIYKNDFVGLSYGNYAQGTNRAPGGDLYGIECQCNTNTDNTVDFIVTDVFPEDAMIRTEQGSQDVASGNTFSVTASWHYRNEGLQYINYFYCDGCPDEEPDMNRVYTTNGAPLFDPDPSDENTCPSHYGGGSGTGGRTLLTGDEKQEREQDFAQNYSDYENVKVLYDNLQDWGNTELLQSEIELSWPQDMWELRAELLGKSPHLSKEVLMAAADKTDVLPESVLFEILSANPDELKEADLIQYLGDKEQPLPQYMINILQQLSYGVTYKTILKRQMAKYHAKKSQAALDMIRSILADSVMDMGQYRNWLDNLGGISADKQIIASYIAENNYSDAQSLLNILPSLYELNGQALTDFNAYKNLVEMQMGWQQQGKSVFELDSLEIALLLDYADYSNGEARNMARGILEFAYGYHYCDCLNNSDTGFMKSSRVFPNSSFETMYGVEINARPNPAGDWTTFHYELSDNIAEGIIEITDVSGTVIQTFTVSGKQGQQLWDTREVKPGVYLYTLKVNGFNKSGKIVIGK